MRLLVHVCCAPDATVALEQLPEVERLALFFDNPNIQPLEEYQRRLAAFERFANAVRVERFIGTYDPENWFTAVAGLEAEPEGGARCKVCIEYRLQRAAIQAQSEGFNTMAAVLTTSPRKKAEIVNTIGEKAAREHGIVYLSSNFKKQDGFKRSVELSRQFGLYRQNYCGCKFSFR